MRLKLHTLERDVARQLGFSAKDRGLLVLDVQQSSPLTGDLRLYDFIKEVGRTKVNSIDDVHRALAHTDASGSVLLKIRRRIDDQSQSRVITWRRVGQ